MMLSNLIDKILSLAEIESFTFDGLEYTSKRLFEVLKPDPEPFRIHTLTGIVDFFESNIDDLDLKDILIIVENHNTVLIKSKLEQNTLKRHSYLSSVCIKNDFPYRNFMEAESFIIELQSKFEETKERQLLLSIIGNIKEENVRNSGDDGITQTVTAKKGISLSQNIEVPNPIKLKPYRTFLEVDQPESEFVFRMQSGPLCALFESDGGFWKGVAMNRIHRYLKDKLPSDITIIS